MKVDLVAIGKVSKPHGVRGELRVAPFFDLEQLLSHFERLWLVKEELIRSLAVERVRRQGRFFLLKLEGVNSLEAAGELRGWQVAVPQGSLPTLPEGQYYTGQLLGLTVITERGEVVGEIGEVLPMPGHDVYRVKKEQGEVLIPAVKEIVVEIDLDRRRMVIRPPEGLLE